MQSSVHRERRKRGFCIKITIWEWKINDFCGDRPYTWIRENMIFSWKNNDFFNEFSMKINDFATLFHLYAGNDENDDFDWKNMNFDRKINDFFTFFHDHEYMEIYEDIDFPLKKQ